MKWKLGLLVFLAVLVFFGFLGNETVFASGALRKSGVNSRYFADESGKTVFLAGSHTWRDFQVIGADNFGFANYLSFLKSNNLNFMRLWIWETDRGAAGFGTSAISPLPFAKSGAKYDLNQFNQAFFDRVRQQVIEAKNQGIFVSIQLFNGWSVGSKNGGPSPWSYHPFNQNNNVNGINGDSNSDGQGYEIETLANPAVTAIQDAYVKKMIDSVNDLDNVLFEIANESQGDGASVLWQKHMIDLIHNYEAGKPKQHPVGFTVPYPNGDNSTLFSSNADFVSPNDGGGYKDNPPANSGSKIVISDTDHLWGLGGDRAWVWKSFTRGLMFSYMDCYTEDSAGCPIAQNDPARLSLLKNMGYARTYAEKMNLSLSTPQANLSSTGFVLADAGKEYLVYQPGNGAFTVDLTSGNYAVEWLNVANGNVTAGQNVSGGSGKTFTPPFSGDAVLYLKSANLTPTQAPAISIGNGDADGNGLVNSLDLKAILASYAKIVTPVANLLNQFNDGSGKINSLDFVVALRQTLKLIPPTTTPTPTPMPTATPTVTPVASPTPPMTETAFPIRISSNKRNLEDQNGSPFLMVGEAAWSLIVQLSNADVQQYLDNRAQKGFNTILVNLIEHKFTSNPPQNVFGDWPFETAAFQSSPNEAYFAHADFVINQAKQRGIVVLLDPLYLGWACGDDGWCGEVGAATTAQMQSYGTYVGNRYKNFTNIIWVVGGDTNPSPVKSKVNAFALSLKQADPNHLITAHNDPQGTDGSNGMGIGRWSGATWLNLNNTYTYTSTLYELDKTAFEVSPTMPYFLIESAYENEHGSSEQERRAQSYWTVLSGGNGHVFGNCPIWHLSGVSSYVNCDQNGQNWKNWLDRQGSVNMKHFGAFFKNIAWQKLVPDFNHSVVTAGFGNFGSANYVTSARASDGTMIVSYLPSSSTLTIDMSKLSGAATGQWFNPSNGAYSTISGGSLANSGSRQFTPPSSGDWVLLLKTN